MTAPLYESVRKNGTLRSPASFCLGLLLTLAAPACGGSNAQRAVSAYSRALEEARYADAYAMLTNEVRSSCTLRDFERAFADPEVRREVLEALRRRPSARLEDERIVDAGATEMSAGGESATLTAEGGDELRLFFRDRFRDGGWRLDDASLELYPVDTPERAVTSLIKAIERQRTPVLERLASAGRDAGSLPAMTDLAPAALSLRLALSAGALEVGADRASLRYARGTLVLLREGGAWKVEAFQ